MDASTVGACEQLRAEVDALRDLVSRADVDGSEVTPFHGWRVRDTIGHLVTIDRLARLTLTDPAAFEAARAAFAKGTGGEDPAAPAVFSRIARYEDGLLAHLPWPQLLARWAQGLDDLCAAAAARDADDRVAWFGAPMRVAALLAARHMEVWAYGQDVFDLYRARRPDTDRIRNVVEFALRTFGFSFAVRGLPAPAAKPFIELTSPSGETWRWNDPDAVDRISGSAVDFCLVATQRRNVADTGLRGEGETARSWLSIAQCIAGPPIDGPRPGERASIG